MIVAVKDELQIKVSVDEEHKVNIEMPDMEEVIFLWESWISQEKISVEKLLKTRLTKDPYPLLIDYLEANGWEIVQTGFNLQ